MLRFLIIAAAGVGLAACDPPEMPMPPPLGGQLEAPPPTHYQADKGNGSSAIVKNTAPKTAPRRE